MLKGVRMLKTSNIKRLSERLRSFMLAGAFLVVQLMAPLSLSGFASALGEIPTPQVPANNGTLKIHEEGTPSGTESNDPKVCTFNVEGFGFDAAQTGYLQFDVQGGDGPTGVPAGPFDFGPTDETGYYASQYFNLHAGHYMATLYGKQLPGGELQDEKAKSKVFKVECFNSSITILKDARPDSSKAFEFTTTGGLNTDATGFELTDDSTKGLPSQNFDDLGAGKYTVTEKETAGWKLSDITCEARGDATFKVDEDKRKVSITLDGSNQHVVCTFTNSAQKPKLSLIKKVEGGSAKPTDWTLWAIPKSEKNNTLSGKGGFPSKEVVADEVYKLVETGEAEGYTASAWVCTGGLQESNYIKLAYGDDVTCTITNSRDTGTVTVNKVLKPAADSGKFDLQINGSIYAENVGNGGTTGAQAVATGEVSVGELAGTDTTLSNYKTYYVCRSGERKVVEGYATQSESFDLHKDQNVVCNFYNVRKPGLTIVKQAYPESDQTFDFWTKGEGLNNFSLTDDGTNEGNSVTFNGLEPGKYVVGEKDMRGWHLKQIRCSEDVKYHREGNKLEVWLEPTQAATCTFVNVHDTAQIRVIKRLYPTNDQGLFNLNIDGTTYAANVGDGGNTGYQKVLTGVHEVSETAGNDTSLDGYVSRYTCRYDNVLVPAPEDSQEENDVLSMIGSAKLKQDYPQTISGYGTSVDGLKLHKHDKMTCVFFNVRKPNITIVKDAQPDSSQAFKFRTNIGEGGRFTLADDGTGEGNSITFDHLSSDGTYTFKEKDASSLGWVLNSITCEGAKHWRVTNNHQLVVKPRLGESVTCTFVNVKKAQVTITKDAQPNSPNAFIFSTNLTGEQGLFSLVDNGKDASLASKSFAVMPGTYTVQEKTLAGWNLSKIECSKGASIEWHEGALSITVSAGEEVDCTFVNETAGGQGGQVLGSSTTAPQGELVNTGNNPIVNLIAGALLIAAAVAARWFGRKQNATSI